MNRSELIMVRDEGADRILDKPLKNLHDKRFYRMMVILARGLIVLWQRSDNSIFKAGENHIHSARDSL